MTERFEDPLAFIGSASCPNCLTRMVDLGFEENGGDAHWRCLSCGLVSITG